MLNDIKLSNNEPQGLEYSLMNIETRNYSPYPNYIFMLMYNVTLFVDIICFPNVLDIRLIIDKCFQDIIRLQRIVFR